MLINLTILYVLKTIRFIQRKLYSKEKDSVYKNPRPHYNRGHRKLSCLVVNMTLFNTHIL
jgi:hypothetical protein